MKGFIFVKMWLNILNYLFSLFARFNLYIRCLRFFLYFQVNPKDQLDQEDRKIQ